MNNLPSHNEQSVLGQNNRTIKLLTFGVGQLNLALPVDIVKKVINYTTIYSSGLNHMGVAHIDDREVTVIDLHKRLYKVSQPMGSDSRGYLILSRNNLGEPFAIWVAKTPTLQDVLMSKVRALPESYRRSDTLEIASHVTVIQQKDESVTVFLLDVDRLVPPMPQAMMY
jgi:chemotaxis signal transduction protein